MHITPLLKSDLPQLLEVIPEGWEGVLPIIEWYTEVSFCHPFKLMVDGKMAGVGVAVFHQDTAWLSHIMVHSEFRKQGIGSSMTQFLIDFIRSKDYKSIYLIATDMGAPVYSKLGFDTEMEYVVFKGDKLPGNEHFHKNVVENDNKFNEQILSLDKQVIGEDRSEYFEGHFKNTLVYFEDEVLQGFYMPDLGDGLIVAKTEAAGHAFMKIRLTSKDSAVFPASNKNAIRFLLENNFKEMYKIKRMFLGKKIEWKPTQLYNRVGGNVG